MANPTTIAAYPLLASKNYQIPFEYLARRFVFVTLVGAESRRELSPTLDFRFTDKTHIETNYRWSEADGFDYIEIRRVTSATDRLVDFNDGSILRATDLNVSQIQSLHIAEEGRDALDDRIGLTVNNELDARGRRIINLSPGLQPTDAVNLNQLKGTEAAAEASRRAAEAAAAKAQQAVNSINAVPGSYLTPRVPPYNAAGDALTNDTAAFTAFERDHVSRTVDLGGATYAVDDIPTGNIYINGNWKLAGGSVGFTRPAFEGDSILNRPGLFTPYGGQLSRFKTDLMDPLCQMLGFVFIGDSITWGSGNQPETTPTDPRNGTLRDPRDYFGTASYVNHVRRYLIQEFMTGATVSTAGWFESPWGEPEVNAVKRLWLLPWGPKFPNKVIGTSISITLQDATTLPTKKRVLISNANAENTQSTYGEISFNFTGTKFGILLGNVAGNEAVYRIFVNDVLVSEHSSAAGTPTDDGLGMPANGHSERTHTIPYVRNGIVTIRAYRPIGHVGSSVMRFGGIFIDKHLRLTNNGINGSTYNAYRTYNMPPTGPNFSGSVAIREGDLYASIQLGSNDRGTNRHAQTIHAFQEEIIKFLEVMPGRCSPILLCANPAKDIPGANLNMEDIRNAIHGVCRERAIDFIDNYTLFRGVKLTSIGRDQLHPNQWGFTAMGANFIKAIEGALDIGVKPLTPPVPSSWVQPTDARLVYAGTAQILDRPATNALLGVQRLLRFNSAMSETITVKVNNADQIGIAFSSTAERCMAYRLTVDGVDQGIFPTAYLVSGGGTQVYANTRWHTFAAGERTLVFTPIWSNEEPEGTQVLYLEGFGIREGAEIEQA